MAVRPRKNERELRVVGANGRSPAQRAYEFAICSIAICNKLFSYYVAVIVHIHVFAMSDKLNRRHFLKASLPAVGAGMISFEEHNLLAHEKTEPPKQIPKKAQNEFPRGKIGDLNISRIICGGNLISGFAHSRDLIYVSDLLRQYFTDEKVFETLSLCEVNGVNTAILRLDQMTLRLINTYWNDIGGKMQWIAQCKTPVQDWLSGIQPAIDNGAHAIYIHGGVADTLVQQGRLDIFEKVVEHVHKNGLPVGIAGHMIDVPKAVKAAGIDVDFYMKTLNAKNYWSAGPEPRNDSVWAETPEETIAFMEQVEKPWIAYKVLGAGAIHPREGFAYAFENGADFLCVGMFDFQVTEDIEIAWNILSQDMDRRRPWRA